MNSSKYRKDMISLNECKISLEQAFKDLEDIDNLEVLSIKMEILKLTHRCMKLSYSINELLEQNQS